MNFKLNTSIVASFVTLLALTNALTSFEHDTELGLLNFLARSGDIVYQDPARTIACFNYYIPLINTIAEEYEVNFKACHNQSIIARTAADEGTLEPRNELYAAAKASCDLVISCNAVEKVLEQYDCYVDGAAGGLSILYEINANASQQLAELRQIYYLIKNDEFKCTNASKRAYEEKSVVAYADFNSCILGTSDIPTNPPPVDTTVAPEQPSTEPQPTTVSPTSIPDITATVSTDEPITATDVTEDPVTEESTTLAFDSTAGFDY